MTRAAMITVPDLRFKVDIARAHWGMATDKAFAKDALEVEASTFADYLADKDRHLPGTISRLALHRLASFTLEKMPALGDVSAAEHLWLLDDRNQFAATFIPQPTDGFADLIASKAPKLVISLIEGGGRDGSLGLVVRHGSDHPEPSAIRIGVGAPFTLSINSASTFLVLLAEAPEGRQLFLPAQGAAVRLPITLDGCEFGSPGHYRFIALGLPSPSPAFLPTLQRERAPLSPQALRAVVQELGMATMTQSWEVGLLDVIATTSSGAS